MKIAIASDHGGYEAKNAIGEWLEEIGYTCMDLGPDRAESVDYPIYANFVCEAIVRGDVNRGILICGTGLGMSMVANRYRGIRAAVCNDMFIAKMSRRHNDSNVWVVE